MGSSIVASVLDRVRIRHRVALDDVQRAAVKGSGRIEPGAVVVIGHLHDERIALPAPARIAHPELDAFRTLDAVRVDGAVHLRPLERDRDVLGRLVEVEGERHVHDPRHAGHVALLERIRRLLVGGVLQALCRGLRQVRDRASLDHASSRRHPVARDVILQAEGGGIPYLPHALQVGLAVRRARHSGRGRVARTAGRNERGDEGPGREGRSATQGHAAIVERGGREIRGGRLQAARPFRRRRGRCSR